LSQKEDKEKFDRAKYLFDQLSLGLYYGAATRLLLSTDPKAVEAAETLVNALRGAEIPGLVPDPLKSA
jgi:hypothetical protein